MLFRSFDRVMALFDRGGDRASTQELAERMMDDAVDEWHDHAHKTTPSLSDYLGLNWFEYGVWLKSPDYMRMIAAARKQRCSVCSDPTCPTEATPTPSLCGDCCDCLTGTCPKCGAYAEEGGA